MSGKPSIASRLSNIKHMPVLMAATAASDKPVDGYLLKDIIKMSFESMATRVFLQQYLINSLLTSSNVYVKVKVLRILTSLCEDGHIEFKQNLRKQPEPFNEASKLKPHVVGDYKLQAECARIRDTANKLLDLIYSETPELRTRPHHDVPAVGSSSSPSLSTQHYENRTSPDVSSRSASSSSRITGFGNTGKSTSTTDKLKSLFGSSKSGGGPVVYDPGYATLEPVPHQTNRTGGGGGYTPTRYTESLIPTGRSHERGKPGGGWEDDEGSSGLYQRSGSVGGGGGGGSRYISPSQTTVEQPQDGYSKGIGGGEGGGGGGGGGAELLTSLEQSTTEQERRLVEEITAPGGIKAAPPREVLNSFIARCKALDCQAIVEFLRVKLQDDTAQVVLRALFVIEAMIRSDIPDVLYFLDLTLEELSSLSASPHSTVKAKATKILRQLETQGQQQQQQQQPQVHPGGTGVDSRNQTQVAGGSIVELGTGTGPADATGNGELEEEPSSLSQENSDLAGLFAGMAVSGKEGVAQPRQQKPRPVKQVQPVKRTKPRKMPEPVEQETITTEAGALDDILGLGDTASAPAQPVDQQATPLPTLPSSHQQQQQQQQPLFGADDSLVDFGEDEEEFDPLKRTGSVSNTEKLTTVTSAAPLLPSQPQPGQPNEGGAKLDVMGQLSGLDISPAPNSTPPMVHRQDSLTAILQPLQTSSAQQLMTVPVTTVQVHPATGMMTGGVVYQPNMVPVMYAAAPGVMYMNQPGAAMPPGMLGGDARPVQRPAAAARETAATPSSDSGFSFLGKSKKSAAFDFVQDEMKASKNKA